MNTSKLIALMGVAVLHAQAMAMVNSPSRPINIFKNQRSESPAWFKKAEPAKKPTSFEKEQMELIRSEAAKKLINHAEAVETLAYPLDGNHDFDKDKAIEIWVNYGKKEAELVAAERAKMAQEYEEWAQKQAQEELEKQFEALKATVNKEEHKATPAQPMPRAKNKSGKHSPRQYTIALIKEVAGKQEVSDDLIFPMD